ncbi:PfkB family carbohydrate kinase [Nesterenkonia pannonica]|uniref:PfkB family carbohydrate kinase n=1 Tax=Nesterenkonia pannonica TaxID=1548602 RepID=UPI002164350D|nr:PfkB family carbohydrate kinase [Nesterenkonia pannonica]
MIYAPSTVAVVGSINQDVTLSVAEFPAAGQTLLARNSVRTIGGKGANQALAAAMVSAKVEMIGCVGQDSGGDEALTLFAAHGVNSAGVVRTPAAPTGSAYICVRGDGENFIVVDPGANALVTVDRFTVEGFAAYSWVLLNLEIPW